MEKMNHKIVVGLVLFALVVSGCSTTRDGLLYRAYHNTHAKYNGFFYAIGGSSDDDYLDTAEKYDPANDRWTPIASMGSPRCYLASVVINGFIYVMGGYDGDWNALDTAEKYDPATDRWTPIGSMGSARWCLASVAL